LVLQQAFSSAQAEGGNCGLTGRVPCAVYLVYGKSSTDCQTAPTNMAKINAVNVVA
jgi:hypothetical protein